MIESLKSKTEENDDSSKESSEEGETHDLSESTERSKEILTSVDDGMKNETSIGDDMKNETSIDDGMKDETSIDDSTQANGNPRRTSKRKKAAADGQCVGVKTKKSKKALGASDGDASPSSPLHLQSDENDFE